jgi:hypothetical protein
VTAAYRRSTACATILITFVLGMAAGVLLAYLAIGHQGRTESADSPRPPAAALVRAIV